MARANAPVTITIDPGSDLARALRDADPPSVVLDSNGVRYRLSREDEDISAGYDLSKIKAALEQIAGLIAPEEAARMKELIYKGREEGTRPTDRP